MKEIVPVHHSLSAPSSPAPWMDDLNLQQRTAAAAPDGPLLVVAGAGTGKTKTLAYRVAHLISQNVDPARIMLLTFSRRASGEMLRRAAAVVSALPGGRAGSRAGVEQVWGGTFHSIANRLLRTYGGAVGLDPNFTVMDQPDAEDLIHLVRYEKGFSSSKKRFPKKGTCLAIYSRCVNSGDPLEETLPAYFPWCAEWREPLKELFKAYVDAKQARNVLDYDDLLLFWFYLLGDPHLAEQMEDRFDHILVDEYQDTNRLQARIIQRMRRRNHNLTAVGDDAQSIYSFRAAEVRNILEFPQQFPGTTQIVLEQNYRSIQPILDATNQLIALAQERYTKDLWSERAGGQKPNLVTCEREEDQTDFVVEKVLEHYEQGIPLRKQAVLFRTGHWADHLEVELTRRNIPYRKFGGLKFLEASHVKDLLAFLRVLENPRDQLAWNRLLNLLDGVGPAIASRCYEFVGAHGGDPRTLVDFPAPTAAREAFCQLGALFGELLGAGSLLPVASEVERIRAFYDPLFERLYENPEPRRRDLEHLEAIARAYPSRQTFLTDLTLDPPNVTGDFAGAPALDDDWLTLSTIHSAKGCEWDVVYLIHASDGILPNDLSTGDAAQIEEERRLLYVACTRARDRLYVTHPVRYNVKKGSLRDAHTYAQLTRFIPPGVRSFFELQSRAQGCTTDSAATVLRLADIRSAIRSMWG
ncbi:MAG: ATP-dependent helicase [Chthoniobacteraceae bacterium]|nr:ATP-dependent helicase [Chthoniobacteraceae bacterium]